jgi:hypothetical protein
MENAMTTVQDIAHLDRFFASWRLCVFAFDREDAKTQRREGGRPGLFLGRPASSGAFSPNPAAPAKPARAPLFDSQPFERGLAEPRIGTAVIGLRQSRKVQRAGASRFARRQIERQGRLAPVADL